MQYLFFVFIYTLLNVGQTLDEPETGNEYFEDSHTDPGFQSTDTPQTNVIKGKKFDRRRRPFVAPSTAWTPLEPSDACPTLKPIEYFRKYISPELFELLVENTNIYAL